MSFRFRIAAWVVVSCTLLIGVMMFTAHTCSLRRNCAQGRMDRHPSGMIPAGRSITVIPKRKSRTSSAS